MLSSAQIVENALDARLVIPAFNVPYLPMIEPVIRAVADEDSFGFVATARLEWIKFEGRSPGAVMEEYCNWADPDHVRLHLDHVPVIDEDNQKVDYIPIFEEATALGYDSVMVDGSRLEPAENIRATRRVVNLAHKADIPCEAELGAVFGHEAGPPPPYEELFESGRGFTDLEDARRFVGETGCDWLSVAIGNVHGAVSGALKDKKKVAARLDLDHLERLREATRIPLVLHGGSGVQREYVLGAVEKGIAKINIGTEIRQTYESELRSSGEVGAAQDALYERTCGLLSDYLNISGSRCLITAGQP